VVVPQFPGLEPLACAEKAAPLVTELATA
jgi:hypothetical protein